MELTEFTPILDTHKLNKIQNLITPLMVANRKELSYRVNIFWDRAFDSNHLKKMKKRQSDNAILVAQYKEQLIKLINEL